MTLRAAARRRSCREVRVKIGNLVSSVQHPRPGPAQLARAPAPISHTLAGTQVGGRREDGGTLIWFLPRFEFKLERGGGLGWRSPHSLARYLRGIFCIFQKCITAYCIQSKCQKIFNLCFFKYFIYFFVYRMCTYLRSKCQNSATHPIERNASGWGDTEHS